jgi:hypothetical protein
MNDKIHRLEQTSCPSCGYVIDSCSNTDDAESMPTPNDLSVCAACGAWNKFDENLKLATLTPKDQLNCDKEVLAELKRVSDLILTRKKKLN